MEKISVTELRAKIYKVTDHVRRTGKPQIITDRGEPAWKLVPIKTKKKPAGKSAKKEETIWEKMERLGPRSLFIADDIENFSVWDEAAWEKKWDERLGKSKRKHSKE